MQRHSITSSALAALRQRRFRLQTAYSNALLHGRGMSPAETTAAFAKARELATSIEDPVERFSAYYGLWVGPFIRGNLAQMHEVAEAFMRDAERWPTRAEAGIAHRLSGTTCWYAGDYAGAQLHLDKALAIYDHERDRHLSSSFAYDQGVLAEFYLGLTLYALGEIDRGARLIEDALRLALQGEHIPTVALTRHYMVVFAAVRALHRTPRRSSISASRTACPAGTGSRSSVSPGLVGGTIRRLSRNCAPHWLCSAK